MSISLYLSLPLFSLSLSLPLSLPPSLSLSLSFSLSASPSLAHPGTDPEDVIRNAFACFDEEGSGRIHEDR